MALAIESLLFVRHDHGAPLPEMVFPRRGEDELAGIRAASAGEIWEQLVQGRITVLGHAEDESHASLFVGPALRRGQAPERAADAAMLRTLLTGVAQKALALDLGIAPSTASLRAANALRALGVECLVKATPLALVVFANAHAIGGGFSPPGYKVIQSAQDARLELRVLRPEVVFRERLTAVEYEVLRAVVEGYTHEQLGTKRDRSQRTIANQLHSIAIKLGTCHRLECINLALRLFAAGERSRSNKLALEHGVAIP
ncbi:MAG TPA: hypothetical protein VM686_35280 [Polyangiaceae bacterium]|jgi:DNA-binding NarL/FixJ family response regulator|nr:hypothetical protein [Polyangiaceae bacterium]